MPIYVWPDYTWCLVEEYNDYMSGHGSDDFMMITVPTDRCNDIDQYLFETKPQG